MVERLVQHARFYEVLGYTLAVLAFAILLAGVIWSLRSHVSQKYRSLFLVASFASLATISGVVLVCLVLSSGLTMHSIRAQYQPPMHQADKSPMDVKLDVDLQADGTLVFEGRQLNHEQLVPVLRRKIPYKPLYVTVHVDADAPHEVVVPVMNQLNQHDVKCSLRVRK